MPRVEIDFSQPLPLFPLPQVVLLPHVTTPLHIFEPRYRAMTNAALDSRGLIAMAVFDGDEWKHDYHGEPALRPHVCVGYIIRHERLADGRYNILLQGVCRARIVDEPYHEPYRVATLTPTEDTESLEIDLDEPRRQIEDLLHDPLLKQLAAVSRIHNWLSDEIPTGALVDLASLSITDAPEQRYDLLVEPDPIRRADHLVHQLLSLRKTLAIADRFGPGKNDEGIGLN